jgi:hypothetical protein
MEIVEKTARQKSGGKILILMISTIRAPLHQSLMPEGLFDRGIGNVVVSRKMNNTVSAGVFLLDVFCLGVKDAFFTITSHEKYQAMLERMSYQEKFIHIQAACGRKLVEETVAYAQSLGFSPHQDYGLAGEIFADIEANLCPTSFVFGRGGKPLFVAGPNDTPKRCKEILHTLTNHCGEDGFHYLIVERPF